MRFLILFLLSLPSWGQITASPATITEYTAQRRGTWPFHYQRPPLDRAITITGSGSWNMSRGGTLATNCGGGGPCFSVATSYNGTCSTTLPTGSGATTVYLCWRNLDEPLVLGAETGTLTIGGTTINITLNILPWYAWSNYTYQSGYPVDCTTESGYVGDVTCTITNQRPDSTGFSIPAAGSTYVDPQFGYTVRRITPSAWQVEYATVYAFNADSTALLLADVAAFTYVWSITGTQLYGPFTVPIGGYTWDATDPDLIWYVDGPSIKTLKPSTGTITTKATYAYNLNTGGTADSTDDNWWTFSEDGNYNGDICAVNLNGLTTSNQASKTFCASLNGEGFVFMDLPQVTQVDSESGERYVLAIGNPKGILYKVGTSSLEKVVDIETTATSGSFYDMTPSPHSDVGQDEEGRQIFFWYWYTGRDAAAYIQLNKAAQMQLQQEVGGGIGALYGNTGNTGGHYGCNYKGMCVFSGYPAIVATKGIQTITTGNPCQINSTAHGYSNGASVQIGAAAGTGVSSLNGVHTITLVNANAYTIPVDCTGATYTANSAQSAAWTAQSEFPLRSEIVVSKIGRSADTSRRIVVHRAMTYSGGNLSDYYSSPRASISRDGRYVAFASNMGVPEYPSVYVVDLGVDYTVDITASTTPGDTTVVFSYIVPSGQGAGSITYSTNPNLTTGATTVSDNQGGSSGRSYVLTGLTANTTYYYRISTGLYSRKGSFKTLPAFSGNGVVTWKKGGGGTINYGTTTSYGSSCTSPCNLSLAKGVWYTDSVGTVVVK